MILFGISVEDTTYSELLAIIERKIEAGEKFTLGYVNANVLLMLIKSEELKSYLKKISRLHADGIGIYLASKFISRKNCLKERINGTDLYYKILSLAEKKKYRVFFYGGSEKAVGLLKSNLNRDFPALCVAGTLNRKTESDDYLIKQINDSNADILFVGLGTPFQEKFISDYFDRLNVPVQIAAGSGIEFLAGTEKRAPLSLQNLGLEWLFRLVNNPKRLYKRYLQGIPEFIYRVIRYKIQR